MSTLKTLLQDALYYHQIGDLDNAITFYKKIITENSDDVYPEVHNNLANIYFHQQNWLAALEHYQQALTLNPDYTEALYNLALILEKQGCWIDAFEHLQHLVSLRPHDPHVLHRVANSCMQLQHYQLAREYYQRIVIKFPEEYLAHYNLAMCYIELHDRESAIEHLTLANTLKTDDLDSLYNLGVLHLELTRYEAAGYYFEEVLQINPTHIASMTNLAICLLRLERRTEALIFIEKGLALEPEKPTLTYLKAALTQQQQPKHAPHDYLIELFDHYAEHYDQHLCQQLDYQLPNIIEKQIKKCVKGKQLEILDLGCGTGLCGPMLHTFAHHLRGIDLSPRMLHIAREKNCYNELLEGDFIDILSEAHYQADLIIAADVLVYCGDLTPVFTCITKTLKANAYFIFNCELNRTEDYQLQPSGRYTHSKAYLKGLAKNQGLTLCKTKIITPRKQQGQGVNSLLVVLSK